MPLLEVRSLSKHFGGVAAVRSIDFSIEEKQIVGLIGPNGAGKTSFFNCLTGLLPIDEGSIFFDAGRHRLDGLPPNKILEKGIARTFQNLRIFREMTLLENISIGFHTKTRSGLLGALARTRSFREGEEMVFRESERLLKFVGLDGLGDTIAGNLSYGLQKRLEIARALACQPKLLCLDEPVAGMNPNEKEAVAKLIRVIRDQGITVLIIEHDMRVVMPLSDKVVVMDEGQKIAEGTPGEIQKNPRVIQAYLGEG